MLVLLGPPFAGADDDYTRLSQLTGLVVYDLRTKIKPGAWGVVRVLGDAEQARDLASKLQASGFRVALVDAEIAHDPDRPIVELRALELGPDHMVLQVEDRSMSVPYKALLTIIEGEVQIGRQFGRASGSNSSSAFRAVMPSPTDMAVFREAASNAPVAAFAAADLHFVTVNWVARIDARRFDFSILGQPGEGAADDLHRLCELLAQRSGARIDRSVRSSSVASFASRPAPMRSLSPVPSSQPGSRRDPSGDERFDAYSRFIAEAERQTFVQSEALESGP
jgi:hypothetical protein